MPVPGYDPEDLDAALEERMAELGTDAVLSEGQLQEYEEGASLVDVLSSEEITRLLDLDEPPESASG